MKFREISFSLQTPIMRECYMKRIHFLLEQPDYNEPMFEMHEI